MELIEMKTETKYPVVCGQAFAQHNLADVFRKRLIQTRVAVITDREVSGYYANDFVCQFERIGIKPVLIVVDVSQSAKSIDVVRYAYEKLTDVEFSPTDVLFALGGGGVMDVAAFVAATYQKGIPYIQVPTSLLAMVDSSMSTDAYLNFQSRKNQIGVTYSPEHVVIDTEYLKTLPPRVLSNGVAQAIQYGLLVDTELLSDLTSPHIDKASLITKCLQARKQILSLDPTLLSFGQEIAEAIEGHFRFMKYSHGEALALGMFAIFPSQSLHAVYERHGLPYVLTGVSKDSLLKRIRKKFESKNNSVPLVRLSTAGKPVVEMIPVQELSVLYDAFLSNICRP